MITYKFRARDIKTNEWVTGDLAYAETMYETKKIKPMIVKHYVHGGIVYIRQRYFVDEKTIELITNTSI